MSSYKPRQVTPWTDDLLIWKDYHEYSTGISPATAPFSCAFDYAHTFKHQDMDSLEGAVDVISSITCFHLTTGRPVLFSVMILATEGYLYDMCLTVPHFKLLTISASNYGGYDVALFLCEMGDRSLKGRKNNTEFKTLSKKFKDYYTEKQKERDRIELERLEGIFQKIYQDTAFRTEYDKYSEKLHGLVLKNWGYKCRGAFSFHTAYARKQYFEICAQTLKKHPEL